MRESGILLVLREEEIQFLYRDQLFNDSDTRAQIYPYFEQCPAAGRADMPVNATILGTQGNQRVKEFALPFQAFQVLITLELLAVEPISCEALNRRLHEIPGHKFRYNVFCSGALL